MWTNTRECDPILKPRWMHVHTYGNVCTHDGPRCPQIAHICLVETQKSKKKYLMISWADIFSILVPYWAHMGPVWDRLGPYCAQCSPISDPCGPVWAHLGPHMNPDCALDASFVRPWGPICPNMDPHANNISPCGLIGTHVLPYVHKLGSIWTYIINA